MFGVQNVTESDGLCCLFPNDSLVSRCMRQDGPKCRLESRPVLPERGSAFFKKWLGAKRLRSVYIYIYIFKRKHVECQTRCKIYETCMFVILPIYEMPSKFHIIHHSMNLT
jgi:hypothetical protein